MADVEVAEEILWIANRKVETVMRPPYARGMQVTASSKYGDQFIYFDKTGFAPGSKHAAQFDFHGYVRLGNKRVNGLCPTNDASLLETLWQIVVCYIFRMDIFPKRKVKIVKGLTISHLAEIARRLLVAMREAGVTCISTLQRSTLNDALSLATGTGGGRRVCIDAFEHMIQMSHHGLLLPSLPKLEWEVEVAKEEKDTTKAAGKQPLSEDEIQVLLAASIKNVNRARVLLDCLRSIVSDSAEAGNVRAFLSDEIPEIASVPTHVVAHAVIVLLTISCANLIFFHLGLRPSELLSLVRGFLSITAASPDGSTQRIFVSFLRSKGVSKKKLRRIEVHPKLAEIAAILEEVNEVTRAQTDILFAIFGEEHEMSTSTLTWRMRRFCALSGIPVRLSSYNWRKSTIDLVARLITNGVTISAVIMDHSSKSETVGYALSSPRFKEDIQTAVMRVWAQRCGTLFESVGKPGALGGIAGKRIEKLLSPYITSEELGLTEDEFVSDMLARNIFPVQVAPGVFCVKPPLARGACSRASRDLMADTANCTAHCHHQVQLPERKQIVRGNIINLTTLLENKSTSRMQKSYAVNRLLDQLAAWPELRSELDATLSNAPQLKKWFPDG